LSRMAGGKCRQMRSLVRKKWINSLRSCYRQQAAERVEAERAAVAEDNAEGQLRAQVRLPNSSWVAGAHALGSRQDVELHLNIPKERTTSSTASTDSTA
jgi:hypothetical protein